MPGKACFLAVGMTVAALVGAVPAEVSAAGNASSIDWRACATPTATSTATPTAPPSGTPTGPLTGVQCAAIDVPLDWADPDGRKITLDLFRLPATGDRIGSVLHVPGGPGAKGSDDIKYFAPDMSELRERFDLVAYNPRNTDVLTKLPEVCAQPAVTHVYEPRTRAEYDAQAAAFGKAMKTCAEQDRSGLFTRMDSISVARDMEAIRVALGEPKLNFMANSAGGVPATAYMRLFPDRIRAAYLDGAVNQPDGWTDQWLLALRPTEEAFDRFTAWCADTPACALHGEDVGKVWRALVSKANREPIPVTTDEFGKGKLTGSYLRWFGFGSNPGPGNANWLTFAASVDKARHGDGSGFANVALGNARVWAMPAVLGRTCGDDRRYRDYADYEKASARAREVSPNLGGGDLDLLACAGWPFRMANPVRPLPTAGLPPILGAGTWTDHPWVESLARRIPGSATVRYEGPGHVLYMSGNTCAIGYATRYFIGLTLPPAGTVCRP